MMKTFLILLFLLPFINISGYSQNAHIRNDMSIKPNKLYKIKVNGKYGLINKRGEIIVEPQFSFLENERGRFWKARSGNDRDGYFVLNDSGEILNDKTFDEVVLGYCHEEELIGVKSDDKWGYLNNNGDLVIPYQFDRIQHFMDGFAVVTKDQVEGFINKEGNFSTVEGFEFYNLSAGYLRLGRIENDQFYYGLYSATKNEWILDPKYVSISKTHNGKAIISTFKSGPGLFNIDDHEFSIEPGYFQQLNDSILYAKPINAFTKCHHNCDCNCPDDRYILEITYLDISKALAIVDDKGTFILKPTQEYSEIGPYDRNYLIAKKGDSSVILDRSAQVVTETNLFMMKKFSNNLVPIRHWSEWGFADTLGNMVINYQYDAVGEFDSNGIATVVMGASWEDIYSYNPSGDAKERQETYLQGYINSKGEYIWKPSR